MTTLNERYDYGLNLELLSVDEGITGYRDDSLETVKKNQETYQLPLTIVSYKDLYGWTMDEIVKIIGLTNNCTFCGVFRRQALDRGAMKINADKILTGHNADDIAETVYMNILRGDFFRLGKCVAIETGKDGPLPRAKPFKYTYEKEIVMYAHFKKLDYFSTECIYSPNAYRGYVRELIKDLEATRPSTIIDIIHSAESCKIDTSAVKMPKLMECTRCGFMSSNTLCKACVLLEGLNSGKTRQAMGRKAKNDEEEVKEAVPAASDAGEHGGQAADSGGKGAGEEATGAAAQQEAGANPPRDPPVEIAYDNSEADGNNQPVAAAA